MKLAVTILVWGLKAYLTYFFLFVGYWKAVGAMEILAMHRAWVAGFPELVARAVGWQEIACALLLLVPAFPKVRHIAPAAALLLLANQIMALSVHLLRGEAAVSAPQNLLLIIMLAIVFAGTSRMGRLTA